MDTSYTNFYSASSDVNKYIGVPQGGYAITSSSDTQKTILFTCYVTSCSVVSFHSSKHKIGALAHFDSLIDIAESLDKIVNKFFIQKIELTDIEITLFGGLKPCEEGSEHELEIESKKLITSLENELEKRFTTIHKETFKKRLFLSEEFFDLSTYNEKLEKIKSKKIHTEESLQKEKKLLEKIDSCLLNGCFTQICLNVETGKVDSTSQHRYLLDENERQKCPAFSEKAKLIESNNLKMMRRGDFETRKLKKA